LLEESWSALTVYSCLPKGTSTWNSRIISNPKASDYQYFLSEDIDDFMGFMNDFSFQKTVMVIFVLCYFLCYTIFIFCKSREWTLILFWYFTQFQSRFDWSSTTLIFSINHLHNLLNFIHFQTDCCILSQWSYKYDWINQ